MAIRLTGKEVAQSLNEQSAELIASCKVKNVIPTLAVVRVGEKEADLSYERGLKKRFDQMGANVRVFALSENACTDEIISVIELANLSEEIHGILVFRPLPKTVDEKRILSSISPKKDVDCVTDQELARVFTGEEGGFAPCTAEACMRILDYYQYDYAGKNAVVVGRSIVIGKPVAMMLLKKHATVMIAHTRTKDLPEKLKQADLIIAAAGHAGTVGADSFAQGQTIIDVGINVNEEGKLCGDVDYETAQTVVEAITPVPGGVGAVTTAVLLEHVVRAAAVLG